MLKKFVTIVLPMAAPVLIYWVYLILARRKARLKAEDKLPGWQDAPWTWIIVSGVALVGVALVTGRFVEDFELKDLLSPFG